MSVKERIENTLEKVKDRIASESESESAADPGKDQMHPAVNKDEPEAFANPKEAGAKKRSEEKTGISPPSHGQTQAGSMESCGESDVHARSGSDPHAVQDQMSPAVNKEAPDAFANPCESGAKRPSEDVTGKSMPEAGKK
jgi:hypothetical protein